MELNYFHKIILLFAFMVLGVGVFNSISQSMAVPYQEISTVTQKYNIVGFEPISEPPTLLSQAWLKNAMVNSFIDVGSFNAETDNQLIVKIANSSPAENLYLLSFPEDESLETIQKELEGIPSVGFVEPNLEIELQFEEFEGAEAEIKESNENKPKDTLTDNEIIEENPKESTEEDLKEVAPQSIVKTQLNVEKKTIQNTLTEPTTQELASIKDSLGEVFRVALIDSGIDKNHPDLKGKKIVTKTYLSDSSDQLGHGTHLAGLIFQKAPNIKLYSYKFTDGKTGKLNYVIRAMLDARKDNVNLINLSLGLPEESSALSEVVKAVQKDGILVVAAAGNQNTDKYFYPAALNGVISVGALDKEGAKYKNSNYGDWIDYSILGQDLYSLAPNSEYKYYSGTSQAAALFSGVLASYAKTPNDIKASNYKDILTENKSSKKAPDSFKLGVRLED